MFFKLISLVCLSSLPYIFNINGEFVFDDSEAIVKNKDVTSEPWTNCFYNDFWGTSISSNTSHKSYRPLTILSFRLDYLLNGKQLLAYKFKITNVFCHISCSILVWCALETMLKRSGFSRRNRNIGVDTAFVTSLLFAVHPVHVEAVAGIVGRADILAAITFFLAFITYDKAISTNSYQYLFAAIFLSGVSMLFKENGITVMGFCICYELVIGFKLNNLFKNKQKGINSRTNKLDNMFFIIRIAIMMSCAVLLLYLRWIIMGGTKPQFKPIDNPAAFSDDVLTKVASYSYIYFLNCLLFIWPQWLCYDWSMGCIPLVKNVLDYRIFFALSTYIYAILVMRAVFKLQNGNSSKRVLILALALTTVPFLPAANIFYPVGFVIAERILYIPSVGYCLFVVIGFNKLLLRRYFMHKTGMILLSFLILIYGMRSCQRSFQWKNEYQLFLSGLHVCPLNAKIHYNVAKAVDAKNQTEWALEEYKESIRLYPEYYQAMNNLANLLKNLGRFSEAEHYLRKAVKYKREFPAAWMNLGIVLAATNKHAEAEIAYNTALHYRKNYPDCYYNLGNLYLDINKTHEAMENWLEAVTLNPKHVLAWTNLLAFLDNSDNTEKALAAAPIALAELPESPAINFAIANIYGKIEFYEDAEKHFLKAIKLFGDEVQALHYSNFGVLYHRWKRYDLAEKMYKKALSIEPSFKSARRNLLKLQKPKIKS